MTWSGFNRVYYVQVYTGYITQINTKNSPNLHSIYRTQLWRREPTYTVNQIELAAEYAWAEWLVGYILSEGTDPHSVANSYKINALMNQTTNFLSMIRKPAKELVPLGVPFLS